MAEEANDKDALLLLLALLAVANLDDPEIIDYLVHSPIRERLRRSPLWTPTLDELLYQYVTSRRRSPQTPVPQPFAYEDQNRVTIDRGSRRAHLDDLRTRDGAFPDQLRSTW